MNSTWWAVKQHVPEGSPVSSGVGSHGSQGSDVVMHLLGQHDVTEVPLDSLSALLPRTHFAAAE